VPRILALSYGVFAAAPPIKADTILLPSDLQPGQTFQIAFLTSGTTSAVSTDISYYNNFVTNAAAAAGLDVINGQEVTWNAVFSTAAIDAKINAPQTSPVYNLDMQLVTAKPGGLWNTSPFILKNPINVTEQGDMLTIGYVWTGSDQLGRYSAGPSAGRGQSPVGIGEFVSIFPNWLSSAYFPATNVYHLYALSSPITVPNPNASPGNGSGGDPGPDPGGDPGGGPGDPGGDPGDPGGGPGDPGGGPGDPGGDPGNPGGDPGNPGGDPGNPGGDPGGDPGNPGGPAAVPEASSIRLGFLGILTLMTRWATRRTKETDGERGG
jgi:hypothetical protein